MGVKVALDDFGTGYANLMYLRRFGFDKLKIDRQFVKDFDRADEAKTLIQSIIMMSRALGLAVTAEAWRISPNTISCAPRAAIACRASFSRGQSPIAN